MVDAAHDLLIRGLGFEVSVKTFGFTTIVKLQPRIRALPDGTFARPVDPVRADADIIKYPILSPLELLALQGRGSLRASVSGLVDLRRWHSQQPYPVAISRGDRERLFDLR